MDEAHNTIAKVSREDLVERARALIPMLRAEADAAERRRAIAPEIITALRELGIFAFCSRSVLAVSSMISAWWCVSTA